MLKQIHFLLTYTCNYECDHCFLFSGPKARGTFTISQIEQVLAEAGKLGTVEWIYFEGGEPFLYYPIMVQGLRLARDMGFQTGVVTNCYWATAHEDAALWLGPIIEAGISDLSLSDDAFHHGEMEPSPAKIAARAAESLGLATASICIESPSVSPPSEAKGEPVVGGGALFKGRAVETLAQGLPTRPAGEFNQCIREELAAPRRVHIDALGHVHACQGVSLGNMWQTPLSQIMAQYQVQDHPICGPLHQGGPVELARANGLPVTGEFIDECHYCYTVRRELIDRYPQYLAPPQVYGLDEE